MTTFRGLFSVLVTPFMPDGQVDVASLRRVVDFARGAGASGVVALGVMGEATELSEDERALVVETVVAQSGGGIPVVVGVSADDSALASDRTRSAILAGASAVMVSVPREPGRLVQHLQELNDAVPEATVVLQDFPAGGHPPITSAELVSAIRTAPNVACIKLEHPPTPPKISAVVEETAVPVLGGLSGLWSMWELRAGAVGVMTGFAFPELLVELLGLAGSGDWKSAADTYRRALPAMVWETQPGIEVALRKLVLERRGVIASAKTRASQPLYAEARSEVGLLLEQLQEL